MKLLKQRTVRRHRAPTSGMPCDDIMSFMTCARYLQCEAERTRHAKVADIFCYAAENIRLLIEAEKNASKGKSLSRHPIKGKYS